LRQNDNFNKCRVVNDPVSVADRTTLLMIVIMFLQIEESRPTREGDRNPLMGSKTQFKTAWSRGNLAGALTQACVHLFVDNKYLDNYLILFI